jgi:phage baseplate assembly protein W
MATFIGFNTIGQNKQFTAVDYNLIKIDLLNAFNIRQGEVVGRPGYGTLLWNYIFENQIPETEAAIYSTEQKKLAT